MLPSLAVPLNCILYENIAWNMMFHSAHARHIKLPTGTRGVGLFFSKDPMFTSCLIFFSKGCPFSWNSATIPDSSDSCLITSCRSSTRWDGVWGWRKDWVHLHQRKFSICINKPSNPRSLLELTSIFRGPYLISWAVSACLNGVGVLGELSRIDLLIAGVLKL